MNFLNSIQSKLHGAVNPNSVQYIKQQDLQVQLDPSGAAYVDHDNRAFSLNVDDENTTALAILDKAPSTQPLSLNSQSQFTICLKHKVQDQNKALIGQYYTNPQYDLSLSSTVIGTLDTFQVNAYKASEGPISYSITGGLTSADLSNADLTGTLTNLYTPLSYTLRSGYGSFVFSLDGLSQQISATMYKKYWVKSVTNLLGDLVFGFSSTGSAGDYLNQPDISFGAGGKYMFDITDSTMTDLSLVFGTTVDDISTVNDSVVTRTSDLVILDISAGYNGDRLVYFEDTSSNMGYVSTGDGADTSLVPTVLWYNFDTSTVTGDNITNVATGSSLGDAIMTRSSIVTDVSKTGTGSLLCVRDSGQSQYVTLPSLTLPSEFTICFWHKMTPDDNFATNVYMLYYLGVNTTDSWNSRYAIDIEIKNGGDIQLLLNHSSSGSAYYYNGIYPNDNEWHHLMFTKSSTDFKVYLDNVERTPNTPITSITMGTFSTSTYNSHYISGRSDVNQTNIYHMGGHTDDYRFYNKVLDSTERDIVYNYAPIILESYTVDVYNGVFRLDSGDGNGFEDKPAIDFKNSSTTYIFDQSDSTNTDNTLIIGTAPDVSSSIVSSGLTIMGTPGQAGAYTKYVSDGSTVYYFSYQTENMGEEPPMYTVKVVDHEVTGEKVFSFKSPGTSTFINQPDLSFGAGDKYQFNVLDPTMADISLVFGTTVDDSASINESVVTRVSGSVILDLTDYVGDRLVYFENTSSNMGYKVYSTSQVNNLNTIFNGVTQPTFYWDFRTTTPESDDTNEYVTDIIGDSLKAVAYGTSFDNLNGPDLSYNKYLQIDPFTFGSPCSIEVYYNIHTQNMGGRIIDFGIGGTDTGDLVLIYDSANYEKLSVYASTKYYEGSQTLYNVWEHGILTLDSGGNLKFYRDKSPVINVTGANITTVNRTVNYIGRDAYTGGTEELDGQVAFTRVWNGHVLTESEISILYDNRDVRYVNIQTLVYTVTVPGDTAVFYLDNESGPTPKPAVDFANNSGTIYIFNQSHVSNANNTLVIGTAPDVSSSIVSSGLTIMGTPGQPGAYTKYVSDGSTVYYFSYQTENMGEEPPMYTVKVVDHEVTGEKVFSLKAPGTSTFINQPDLSFGAGDKYQFNVLDPTMADFSLVFGTTVDDSTSINESVVTRVSGSVILDLTDYVGDRLVYFEDSSAGMGYAPASSFHQTPTTDVPVSREPYSNPSKEFNVLKYNNVGDTNTFALENTQLILDFINEHYDGNTLTVSTESESAFKESQRLYYMHNDTIYYMFLMWFNAIWVPPEGNDNYYSLISENNTDLEANYGSSPRDFWLSDYGIGSGTSSTPVSHANGTNVGNNTDYNAVDYASIGIPQSGNITVYYGDPLIQISNVEYTITVVSGVFHVDGSPTPTLSLINGLNYVFDQSHASNTGNTLVIGTAPDISSSIVSSGLTIMGTPGQPGAYTHYVSDGSTVYYFSYQSENMGEEPPMYTVKVVDHEVTGEKVFSFKSPGGSFINQPDLSFGAGDRYQFDVTDSTMTDISLVFGTTVDDSASINESVVTRVSGSVILDLTEYTGDRLVYFEDSSAGMGYVSSSSSETSGTAPQLLNSSFENNDLVDVEGTPTTFYVLQQHQKNIDNWTTIVMPEHNRTFIIREDDTAGFNFPTPFVDGSYCMGLGVGTTQHTGYLQQIISLPVNNYILSWYDVLRTYAGMVSEPIRIKITKEADSTVIHTHEYLVTNTAWTEKTTSFSITEEANYIVSFESYYIDSANTGQTGFDKVTFSIAPPPVENYTVDVYNGVFRLDSGDGNGFVEKPAVAFNSGTAYIFDQSDSTNTGNTLVIGTAPDISSSIVSSGLTIMGTPGQAGAYTKYVSDGSTVYYFSYQTENMGEEPPMYTVKVVDHEVTGEKVFSLKAPGTSTFINQPDLSFGAGDRYQFDVTDSTMTDISLVFGTTVDDSTSINESVVTRVSGSVILDLTDYVGDRLVYFENTSAGMGYVATGGPSSVVIKSKFVNTVATTPPTNDLLGSQLQSLSFTASNSENTFANGDYIIEASSQDGNGRLAKCINNTQSIEGFHWHGVGDIGHKYVSKIYTGTVNTTVGATTISGEWIQLTMPYRMVLKKLLLGGRFNYYQSYPGLIYMVGSNDGGTTFEIIDSSKVLSLDGVAEDTGGTIEDDNSAENKTETTFSTTYSYSTIRMIVNELIPTIYEMPVNVGRWELTGDVVEVSPTENYTVDVANSVFRLDNGDGNGFADKPLVTFNSGTTYIFDQSNASNTDNTLVIGTDFDVSSSIVSSGLTIMGTPGQPGAYTKYVSDGSTVHYFSYQTENMGLAPPNITDDLYVHYDFEFPLYDPTGTERTDGSTGNSTNVRVYNKAYDSSTNSDISYNGYLAPFGNGGGARLDSTVQKFGSSSLKVNQSPVRSDNAWKLNNDQGYSICFWMKEDSASGPLFGMDNVNGAPFFVIEYNSSTLTVNNNGTTLTYNISALTMTDWNHIAFTISPDGPDITWKLYINGSLVNTKTDGNYLVPQNIRSGYPVDLIFLVDIGARPGWSSYIGYFDDFRFYKTELSQAQVSAVYSYTG